MEYSKRFPVTQIIDGEHCPPYYDPTHYRQAMEFAPERGDIIEVTLGSFHCAHGQIVVHFILKEEYQRTTEPKGYEWRVGVNLIICLMFGIHVNTTEKNNKKINSVRFFFIFSFYFLCLGSTMAVTHQTACVVLVFFFFSIVRVS